MRPRHFLSPWWKETIAELVELESLPEHSAEPDVTEDAPALDTNPFQIDACGLERVSVIEEINLVGTITEKVLCKSGGLCASLGVELTKVRDSLLADFLPFAH